jgi:hypothetical protein
MRANLEIRPIWRTESERCEVVWSTFSEFRVRVWLSNRLLLDEVVADMAAAVRRAWELRTEWPQLVD